MKEIDVETTSCSHYVDCSETFGFYSQIETNQEWETFCVDVLETVLPKLFSWSLSFLLLPNSARAENFLPVKMRPQTQNFENREQLFTPSSEFPPLDISRHTRDYRSSFEKNKKKNKKKVSGKILVPQTIQGLTDQEFQKILVRFLPEVLSKDKTKNLYLELLKVKPKTTFIRATIQEKSVSPMEKPLFTQTKRLYKKVNAFRAGYRPTIKQISLVIVLVSLSTGIFVCIKNRVGRNTPFYNDFVKLSKFEKLLFCSAFILSTASLYGCAKGVFYLVRRELYLQKLKSNFILVASLITIAKKQQIARLHSLEVRIFVAKIFYEYLKKLLAQSTTTVVPYSVWPREKF